MWFRNLQLYRFNSSFSLTEEQLADALSKKPFAPCLSQQDHALGWVPPLGKNSEQLVHSANGYLMICARREDRLLPTGVVNEHLAEKISEIELQESRKVRGKEKAQLKDEIRMSLLPKAFTRSQFVYAYLNPLTGWLVINASSSKKAEEFIMLLRESLGSLPVKPLNVNTAPHAVMTQWLQSGQADHGFSMENACELHATSEQGGVVKIQKQELDGDEIQVHLDAGKLVTKMALSYQERLAFILNDALEIKSIKFLDLVQEDLEDISMENPEQEFDARFVIMTGEFEQVFEALIQAMGGELEEV